MLAEPVCIYAGGPMRAPLSSRRASKEAFGPFGQNFVKIVVSQSPDRPARAFVEFQNKADAEAALNSPALRETFAPVRRDAPMTQPSPRLHVSREAGSLGMTVAEERALFARFGPNTVSAPEGESYYFFVEYETQAAADAVLREPGLKGKFDVGYAKTRLEGPNLTLFVVMKEGPAVPMAGLRRQDVRESFAKFGGPRLRFVRTRKDAPLIFADFQNQVDADAALNSPEMKENPRSLSRVFPIVSLNNMSVDCGVAAAGCLTELFMAMRPSRLNKTKRDPETALEARAKGGASRQADIPGRTSANGDQGHMAPSTVDDAKGASI
ncbi:unnamed protein product [Mycena citricolor]|uniref:RRM domain-containing protein n=1 Tax=Mycena citricolor TaxID=2018698 RepID=A0AAD2K062_9AGAR|nr:unnamed protein product [Mycena citricolor]